MIAPLFDGLGLVRHSYHSDPLQRIRGYEYGMNGNFEKNPNINENDIAFLWGLSMERRLADWPKPIRYITVLRHPVLRFISVMHNIALYATGGSFWELNLWGEKWYEYLHERRNLPCNEAMLKKVVDGYSSSRPTWCRTQFGELLDRVDYGGLEWWQSMLPCPDDRDPLANGESVSAVVRAMENKYQGVYILELQEESALQFAIDAGLDPNRLQSQATLRHEEVRGWDETDFSPDLLSKIQELVAPEMAVYNYFRKKFEAQFIGSLLHPQGENYFRVKGQAIQSVPKLRRHMEGKIDPMYISQAVLQHPEMLDAMRYCSNGILGEL